MLNLAHPMIRKQWVLKEKKVQKKNSLTAILSQFPMSAPPLNEREETNSELLVCNRFTQFKIAGMSVKKL